MFRYPFLGGSRNLALLLIGLLTISASVLLISAASQTISLASDQDLSKYWRTSYDLLVRPNGAQSPIEEKYNLVEANHLSGIFGGISFEQYELIKSIPGVDITAPIAMLGYIYEFVSTDSLGLLTKPGAYVVIDRLRMGNNANSLNASDFIIRTYYYITPELGPDASPGDPNYPIINPSNPISSYFEFPFMVAGIDPNQEAALVGLDQAMVDGEYLQSDDPLYAKLWFHTFDGPPIEIQAPVLINATPYISATINSELKHLILPDDVSTLESIMALGGRDYLDTLPGDTMAVQDTNTSTLYPRMVEQLQGVTSDYGFTRGGGLNTFTSDVPGKITYRETSFPFYYKGLMLDILLPAGGPGIYGEPAYRSYNPFSENIHLDAAFTLNIKGIFNIEDIPRLMDNNRVPMETYFPPLSTLLYDESGRPVKLKILHPTLNTAGYIQPPPLVLTTLDAARAIRGDNAISAIRVRVGGIDHLSPTTQRKIETIASEIQRQTGLDVDIMVGSSPTRVLVHVPGVGYVEEQWIQKGVSTSYKLSIQSGYWILLGVLLTFGGLFTLDLTWVEVVARQRDIALQKALGWRSRTVFAQVTALVILTSTVASIGGMMSALGLIYLLGLQSPSGKLLVVVLLLVMGSCIAGGFYSAWIASRVPPTVGFQQSDIYYYRKPLNQPILGIWQYSFNGLLRRRRHAILNGLSAALSAALLVLMLAVIKDRQGLLEGTLLGEYILTRIDPFYFIIIGIGFGVTAISILNNLLRSVSERQREIGVLKAIGWRTGEVMRLFMLEGTLIGLIGGGAGTLLGSLAYYYLYMRFPSTLIPIALLSIALPVLVGTISAFYPGQIATKVPPAEAIRYE